ncbi:hypothetical protein RDI58_004706 [Solanum bulbocastanum]|uniref:Uncharacterized protein n=1 Tax=Solanum bulbocastanum TaxID=147425 RepID=A0AAN8YLL6_SOLBU
METTNVDQALCNCHILVIPYPGRGHINPLMNLCKLIATTSTPNHLLQVSFIVTEEWFSLLKSEQKPDNIKFLTTPNVIPSEKDRSKDLLGFVEAVYTKMEALIDSILDGISKPNVILVDSYLTWAVRIGERRNIPVASFWPMSPTVFSILHHHQLLLANGHFEANLTEQGEEVVNYIPGIKPICVKDLPSVFYSKNREMLHLILKAVSLLVNKAQYALFTTIEPLESQVIEALQDEIPVPIFTVGPTIPFMDTELNTNKPSPNYLSWLDDQPKDSVLYISQGSFLSVSNTHVGGFWSHCGWNSTKEGAFAGVPFLTFPIVADQFTNSKQIVEDWKIGWRVNKESENLVKRDEIALLVQSFMDLDSYHGREMRKRAMEIRKIFQESIESGAIQGNINKFIRDISRGPSQ